MSFSYSFRPLRRLRTQRQPRVSHWLSLPRCLTAYVGLAHSLQGIQSPIRMCV